MFINPSDSLVSDQTFSQGHSVKGTNASIRKNSAPTTFTRIISFFLYQNTQSNHMDIFMQFYMWRFRIVCICVVRHVTLIHIHNCYVCVQLYVLVCVTLTVHDAMRQHL